MSQLLELLLTTPSVGLLARIVLIAGFVMLVTVLAERLGPFLGGMVASLPLYTGPTYLLLALEHDAAYLQSATVGSIAICGVMPVFVLVYCMLARRHGILISLGGALATWAGGAVLIQLNSWTLIEALLFVAPIYVVSVALARGFTRGIALRRAERNWIDLPVRACTVAGVAGLVIFIARYVPPQITGILSVLPVIMTSLTIILHPRIGGPATAALFAHTLGGLVGMVLAFALINLAILKVGAIPALAAGLAVTLLWNLLLIGLRRITHPPAAAARLPGPQAPSPHRPGRTAARDLPPPRMPRPIPPRRSKAQ